MSAGATAGQMTYADYCEFERRATLKHEYLRGEVFAMTGRTLEHARSIGRVIHLLSRELAEGPCRVFSSDARVRVEETDLDTYPDASVVCGEPKTSESSELALVNPMLLVEVLSDSTEAYDRGQKAAHYRRIPSLRGYLLVSQHEPRLELFVRRDDGSWSLFEVGAGESLVIEPLAISIGVDEVYRDALPQ